MAIACPAEPRVVGASYVEELRRRLGLIRPAGWDGVGRLRGHPRAAELYPSMLILQHMIVRGNAPLLRIAEREGVRRAAAGDRVAAALVDHLRRRTEEDCREEERLLDDYAALDRDVAEVIVAVPSPTVAALVGAAYYWVLHHHPVAVLGYFAVLDSDRPSTVVVAELQATTGHPAGAFTTLARRAVADRTEREDVCRLIDVMPLGPAHVEAIAGAAVLSVRLLTTAIDELLDRRLVEDA